LAIRTTFSIADEVFRTPHEKPGLVRDAGDMLANNARLAEGIAQKILPFPDLEVPLIAVQLGMRRCAAVRGG